jgi:hypothetical protein
MLKQSLQRLISKLDYFLDLKTKTFGRKEEQTNRGKILAPRIESLKTYLVARLLKSAQEISVRKPDLAGLPEEDKGPIALVIEHLKSLQEGDNVVAIEEFERVLSVVMKIQVPPDEQGDSSLVDWLTEVDLSTLHFETQRRLGTSSARVGSSSSSTGVGSSSSTGVGSSSSSTGVGSSSSSLSSISDDEEGASAGDSSSSEAAAKDSGRTRPASSVTSSSHLGVGVRGLSGGKDVTLQGGRKR